MGVVCTILAFAIMADLLEAFWSGVTIHDRGEWLSEHILEKGDHQRFDPVPGF